MDVKDTIQMINVDNIIPNRFQPRLAFDDQGINELASSIKEHGIIQPLVLRKLGDKYEIIAGERRYKAANVAGLTEVPAIISNLDDNQSAEVALVENVQRRNLTSIEEAKSYKKILDKGYLTQEGLATKMGISQSAIANKLRLLNLSTGVQEALLNERISERHARSLLQITDLVKQEAMLKRVISERMTVRQLDAAIKEDFSPQNQEINNNVTEEAINPFNNDVTQNKQLSETLEPKFDFQEVNQDINSNQTLETLDLTISEDLQLEDDPIKPKETSKILNIFDKTEYPSLEDQEVNLSFEHSSENILDINKTEEKEETTNEMDSLEIVPEITQAIQEEPKQKIITNDLNSITNALKELETEIKNAGFKISTEEFNFEDLYQVIIKIDKQAE